MFKLITFIFLITFTSALYSQDVEELKMTSFVPKSNAYDIY